MTAVAFISHPDCLLHNMGELHPELPQRVDVIQKAVEKLKHPKIDFYAAPLADQEDLLRVHDLDYVTEIFNIRPEENRLFHLDPDTAMNTHTLQAALRAAGSVILAVDLVMHNQARSVFCNVRPPGHHAEKNKAMGFCFFNNLAVGVAYALAQYHLKRIAIIDFDVHHGNGTENIFADDPRVLLCSSFQHPFYPNSGAETINDHILNLPLSSGTTGKVFREKVTTLWLPKIAAFKPELIFISAGFDAYIHDAMANLAFEEADYAWITSEIKKIANEWANGKIISVLEGGYHLEGLSKCVVAHVQEL